MPYSNQGNYYRPSGFGGFSFFPPVIKTLLITNAVIFFAGLFKFGGFQLERVFSFYFGLMPIASGNFYPWQLITYQFLHGDFQHILFNMFSLWMFGMEMENIWGSRKFLIFYLTCGVVAGISQLILAPIFEPLMPMVPTVGASGAIYGVLVAFAMYYPDRYIYFYMLLPIKAKYLIPFFILMGVFAIGNNSGVAELAHLGGAAAGFVYVLLMRRSVRGPQVIDRVQQWAESVRGSRRQSDYMVDDERARVYDIRDAHEIKEPPRTEAQIRQQRIDEILDKISRSGYQNLTDEEKRILFEESKKIN